MRDGADQYLPDGLGEAADDDELFAAMLELQDQAAGIVDGALSDEEWAADPPAEQMAAAVEQLVEGVTRQRRAFRAIRRGAGWDAGVPTSYHPELLWVQALASTVAPLEDPGTPVEEQAAVGALDYADWVGIVLGAHREGAGVEVTGETAVRWVESCEEIEGELDEGGREAVDRAVELLLPMWRALGVVDAHDRLTELGAWGLPRGFMAAFDLGEDEETGDDGEQ